MDKNSIFGESPLDNSVNKVYPENKGVILIYPNGDVKALYGKEHTMLMQKIGYWYIDNWQVFLLNYAYNGVMVIMIESGTSLVYLPKDIEKVQIEAFAYHIKENISFCKRFLLNFYMMRCKEKNDNYRDFNKIERDNRGRIRHIKGEVINGEEGISYSKFIEYLNSEIKMGIIKQ